MKKIIITVSLVAISLMPAHRSLTKAWAQETIQRETTTNVYEETPRTEPANRTVENKTVVVEEKEEDDGLLGGPVFHIIGEVLAFPFRAVANVIDFIF